MKKETKMDESELRKERRKQTRLEKLGTNNPICGACGHKAWQALELHHVADHKRDEAKVILCRNCHRIVSDDQKDHPAFNPEADPQLDRIGHFMLGLADLLRIIFDKLNDFGRYLIERAQHDFDGEAKR
jgi:hypothetical protein